MSLTKEAMAQVGEALGAVPGALRALSARNQHLEAENAGLKVKLAQSALATEIVDMMEANGMGDESYAHHEKVAMLLGSEQDLSDLKRAVELRPQVQPFAKLAAARDSSGGAGDGFAAYILS